MPSPPYEPASPVLTADVLGEHIDNDPLARAAWHAGMTQAEFIRVLLKDRAEMQAQLTAAAKRRTAPWIHQPPFGEMVRTTPRMSLSGSGSRGLGITGPTDHTSSSATSVTMAS